MKLPRFASALKGGVLGIVSTAAVSVAVAVGLVAYLSFARVPLPSYALDFVPAVQQFSVALYAVDRMQDPPRLPSDLLWEMLSISSTLEYSYGWPARPTEHCRVANALKTPHGIVELKALRTRLAALPREVECEAPCPTCPSVQLTWALGPIDWRLGDVQLHLVVSHQCWQTSPELGPVRRSLARVASIGPSSAVCKPWYGR